MHGSSAQADGPGGHIMAENGSRFSIFLVAVPSLLLVGLVAVMVTAYDWSGERDPPPPVLAFQQTAATPAEKSPLSPATTEVQANRVGTRCGADEPLRPNQPVHVHIVDCQRPLRLRFGNLRISAMWREPRGRNEIMEAVVTVRRRGLRPQIMVMSAAIEFGLLFNIGRLDPAGN